MRSYSKTEKLVRYVAAIMMVAGMTIVAGLTGDKEIIFPEIAALVTGAWLTDRMPWDVSYGKMFLLMTVSSTAGIVIVRLPIPLFIKLVIGILLTAMLLTVSRTTMSPLVSACILPILMETESPVYVIAVAVMVAFIIGVRLLLERGGWIDQNHYVAPEQNWPQIVERWLLVILSFLVIAMIAVNTYQTFVIAPPLIVALVEMTNPGNQLKKRSTTLCLLVFLCACCGAIGRGICMMTGISINWIVVCVILLVFLIMYACRLYFPPAGALAILPFLIRDDRVLLYPVQVVCGCIAFVLIARVIMGMLEHDAPVENM